MARFDQSTLSEQVNRKLFLAEIEFYLARITESLLNDSLYTNEDAVKEIIKVTSLINAEKKYLHQQIRRDQKYH